LTRLEYVVLGLLVANPSHGYALKRQLGPGLAREHQINDGVLYPLLTRLERRGLTTSSSEPGTAGRARKVYAATAEGRATFLDWLRSTVGEHDDLGYDLFVGQPLVKLLFAGYLSPDERADKVASLADAARTRLVALERLEAAAPRGGWPQIARTMIDLGLEHQRATIAALERLVALGVSAGTRGESPPVRGVGES
jgi:DNA-binding PadR family transcriptional regulator